MQKTDEIFPGYVWQRGIVPTPKRKYIYHYKLTWDKDIFTFKSNRTVTLLDYEQTKEKINFVLSLAPNYEMKALFEYDRK